MAVHHIPQSGTFSPTGRKDSTRPHGWVAPVVAATMAAAAVAGIIGLTVGSSDTTTATISNAEYAGLKTALAESVAPTQSAAADSSSQLVENARASALAGQSAAASVAATDSSFQLVEDARASALAGQSAAASVATQMPDQFLVDAARAERNATTAASVTSYRIVEDAIAGALADRTPAEAAGCPVTGGFC